MLNIQVLNNISPLGLEKFSKETYEVSSSDENPDAILVRSAKMHDMEIGDSLKALEGLVQESIIFHLKR